MGLRLSELDEHLGSDFVEHQIHCKTSEDMPADPTSAHTKRRRSAFFGGRRFTASVRSDSPSVKVGHFEIVLASCVISSNYLYYSGVNQLTDQ